MNNEIKEIQSRIDKYKNIGLEPTYCEELITTGELQRLLDHITDLEKRFNSLLEAHKICDELEQEKQERIDKAIEYIEQWRDYKTKRIDSRLKGTLNILQGSDK